VAPMSVINAVTLGTLAAIRPPAQMRWSLGIVRRMKRLTTERAEIGLQVIANNLIGVELTEAKRDDPEVLIGGDVSTLSKRSFNGLFLSLRKRDGETAVQTLVVPPGEYQPGKRLYMSAAQSSQRIAFGRVLEQHPDWVWATVEPLVTASQAASSTTT
jgi:hypothetical protein